MEIEVRRLEIDDEASRRVVEIQRSAYAVEAELIGFSEIPPLRETVEDVLGLTHLEWLGAYAGPTLVGVVAWTGDSRSIDIDRLAVDPAHARVGHGRRLLEALPVAHMTSVSTAAANGPARALYESLGFINIGVETIDAGLTIARYEKAANFGK